MSDLVVIRGKSLLVVEHVHLYLAAIFPSGQRALLRDTTFALLK